MTAKIIVLTVMCVLLCVQMGVYTHHKLQKKGRAYTLFKCAGSLIFTLTAFGSMLFAKPDGYTVLILCATVLSSVGDYFLSLPHGHHRLKAGAGAFAAAHCFFVIAFMLAGGFHWQTIPFIVLIFLIELLGARLIKLNFRGAGKSAASYILVVTTMAVTACSLLFADAMPKTAAWLTAVGGTLFLLSDILWMLYGLDKDVPNKVFKALNVVTYFPAVMLIASALYFR